MTLLRFTFREDVPDTPDVPVEVRRQRLALVARTTARRGAEVEPGTYHVIARLPDGTELATTVEARGPAVDVPLAADPGELVPAFEPPVQESEDRAGTVKLRFLTGNLLTGAVKPVREEEVTPSSGATVHFASRRSHPGPVYVELVQTYAERRLYAVPATPGRTSALRLVRLPEGGWGLDVHLAHAQADLLCRYREHGLAADTAALSESLEDAQTMLFEKLRDPVAASAGAYALLRFSALDRLHDWTENLRRRFKWLPDGAAIRGEHLARLGDHARALQAFNELADRGVPLFSDGLGYALARLELYVTAGAGSVGARDLAQAEELLAALRPLAGDADFAQPILSFPGPPERYAARRSRRVAKRTEPVATYYVREIHRALGRWPTWLPGSPVRLGDCGTFDRFIFIRRTSLNSLGISFEVEQESRLSDLTHASGGVAVTFQPPGQRMYIPGLPVGVAGIEIRFAGQGVLMVLSGCTISRIAHPERLATELRRIPLARQQAIVTEVVTARSATILVGAKGSLTLRASGDVPIRHIADLARTDAGFDVVRSTNLDLSVISKQETPLLFRAMTLSRRRLGLPTPAARRGAPVVLQDLDPETFAQPSE